MEALWDGEVLAASDALLARAKLAVEVDHALAGVCHQRFPSTLQGPPHLVLLTLVRACDDVRVVEYDAAWTGTVPRTNQSQQP